MAKSVAILILAFVCFESLAVERDSVRQENIESYSDYFFLGPLLQRNSIDFSVVSSLDSKKKIDYKSNTSYALGANLNLFDVNIRFAFAVPLGTKSERLFGKSDIKGFQIAGITRRWFADASFIRYNGFYRESSDVAVPKGQPFPQRSDIEIQNHGISFGYIFNHDRFSLKAPYLFSERQKNSRGSFIISGVLSTFTLSADSALVPLPQWTSWGPGATVSEIRFTSFGVGPGYSHTFVMKRFFVNLTLTLGPAHYWLSYTDADRGHNDIKIDAFSQGRIGVGYNTQKFFAGLSITTQSRNVTYDNITLQNGAAVFRIVTGYRLPEEGLLKRKATELLPIGL